MSWDGYFRYADTEIINAARVRAYADSLGLAWVQGAGTGKNVGALAALLGDEAYTTPAIDSAPWYDPDSPESGQFAGVLPLSVAGVEDSTRESSVFEFTSDGGNPGRLRHATKAVVFSVALVGVNEAAVEYGMRWLKRALMRRQCAPGSTVSCAGERLVFARHQPLDDPLAAPLPEAPVLGPGVEGTPSAVWLTYYQRHLNDVLVNRGPIVNRKRTLGGCNGVVWLVSFTAVAGDAFEYGTPFSVLDNMISRIDNNVSPYVSPYAGSWGENTYPYATCPAQVTTPIFDPVFSPFVAPPQAPDLMPAGFTLPTGTQNRMYAHLPDAVIPLWDEVRPVIRIAAGPNERRMVRVRFFPEGVPLTENCAQVGEFILSYIPPDYTLVIDSEHEAVYAYSGTGATRRADSMVFGTIDAKPIQWFGLSCGESYLMTVDHDGPIDGFDLDLDLVPRSA